MNSRVWGIIGGLALLLALLSPYVLGSTKKLERLFEAAETLYEQNDYEGAIEKYNEALMESNKLRAKTETIDKDFTTYVNFKIAMSYVKLAEHENNPSHYEIALEHVEKAAQIVKFAEYEENLTYLWGHILYKTEQLEQAREKFKQLLDKFPNSRFAEKAQETIAQINAQLQDTEEIIVDRTEFPPLWINDLSKFEAFSKKKNSIFLVADQFRLERQYVRAAEHYEAFAAANPATGKTAYALYWAGMCYYEGASADEMLINKSRVAFNRLINNHTNSSYVSRAHEMLDEMNKKRDKDKVDKTIADAENAVSQVERLNSRSALVRKAISLLRDAKEQLELDNYEVARQLANNAQETAKEAKDNYEKAKRYVNQGYTDLRQGLLDKATEKARDALRVDPPYQKANNLLEEIKQKYFSQGVNYIEAEEYAKAIPYLEKAIGITPFKEAYCHLGWAYVKLGKFEQAIATTKKLLAIDPEDKCALEIRDSIDPEYINVN